MSRARPPGFVRSGSIDSPSRDGFLCIMSTLVADAVGSWQLPASPPTGTVDVSPVTGPTSTIMPAPLSLGPSLPLPPHEYSHAPMLARQPDASITAGLGRIGESR